MPETAQIKRMDWPDLRIRQQARQMRPIRTNPASYRPEELESDSGILNQIKEREFYD